MEFSILDSTMVYSLCGTLAFNIAMMFIIFLYIRFSTVILKEDKNMMIGDDTYKSFMKDFRITQAVVLVLVLVIIIVGFTRGDVSIGGAFQMFASIIFVIFPIQLFSLLSSDNLFKFLNGRQDVAHDERNYENTTVVKNYFKVAYTILGTFALITLTHTIVTVFSESFYLVLLNLFIILAITIAFLIYVMQGYEAMLKELYDLDTAEQNMLDQNISADLEKVKDCTTETDVKKLEEEVENTDENKVENVAEKDEK